MRAFWFLVGVVVVLAIIAMARGNRAPGLVADRQALAGEPITVARPSDEADPTRPGPAPAPAVEPDAVVAPPTKAHAADSAEAPSGGSVSPATATARVGPPEPDQQPTAPVSGGGDPLDTLAAQAAGLAEPKPDPAGEAIETAAGAPGAASPQGEGRPFEWKDDPAFGPDRYTESTAIVRPDGAILLDGRFVVRGAGTAEDPYRIPWELLESAQEVYKPRAGQKKLPRRVTFLHNKHVRISGFVAFPIASNNPRECLVMLNQWDGCCIGVMPTAFDAVEVRLGKAATADQRMATHGELRGKFKVDPFEDGGWLISLYLMDDGTLKADQ